MCEECDSPNALHLSYVEKRARMRAVWQPRGKSRMGFMASRAPTTPAAVSVDPVVAAAAEDDKRGV